MTSRVEWQDIFEGESLIVDESGHLYKWHSSKKEEEYGTVYDYTLIQSGKKFDLIDQCLKLYKHANCPIEFTMRAD